MLADAWEGLPYAGLVPLFIALCCAASFFGVFCLFRIFSSGRRPWHVVGLIAATPFGIIAISFFSALRAQHQQHRGGEFAFTVPPMAREYAQLYPDRIHRIGSDEECILEGFPDWFRHTVAVRKHDWPDIIRIFSYRDGQILDPRGVPVAYACDFNLDGVIDFRGKHFQVIPRGDSVGYNFWLAVVWHPNRPDEDVPILFY